MKHSPGEPVTRNKQRKIKIRAELAWSLRLLRPFPQSWRQLSILDRSQGSFSCVRWRITLARQISDEGATLPTATFTTIDKPLISLKFMGMVNELISYMEVVEHLGWSTVVDNTRNTNASNPILERLVTMLERAMT